MEYLFTTPDLFYNTFLQLMAVLAAEVAADTTNFYNRHGYEKYNNLDKVRFEQHMEIENGNRLSLDLLYFSKVKKAADLQLKLVKNINKTTREIYEKYIKLWVIDPRKLIDEKVYAGYNNYINYINYDSSKEEDDKDFYNNILKLSIFEIDLDRKFIIEKATENINNNILIFISTHIFRRDDKSSIFSVALEFYIVIEIGFLKTKTISIGIEDFSLIDSGGRGSNNTAYIIFNSNSKEGYLKCVEKYFIKDRAVFQTGKRSFFHKYYSKEEGRVKDFFKLLCSCGRNFIEEIAASPLKMIVDLGPILEVFRKDSD